MPQRGLQRSRTPKQRKLRVLHVWWAAANWLRSDSRRAAVSLLQSCRRRAETYARRTRVRRHAVDAVASELTPHGPRRHRRESQRSRAQARCSSRARSRAPSRRTRRSRARTWRSAIRSRPARRSSRSSRTSSSTCPRASPARRPLWSACPGRSRRPDPGSRSPATTRRKTS